MRAAVVTADFLASIRRINLAFGRQISNLTELVRKLATCTSQVYLHNECSFYAVAIHDVSVEARLRNAPVALTVSDPPPFYNGTSL